MAVLKYAVSSRFQACNVSSAFSEHGRILYHSSSSSSSSLCKYCGYLILRVEGKNGLRGFLEKVFREILRLRKIRAMGKEMDMRGRRT